MGPLTSTDTPEIPVRSYVSGVITHPRVSQVWGRVGELYIESGAEEEWKVLKRGMGVSEGLLGDPVGRIGREGIGS